MIDVSALKINVNNYFEGFNLNSFARLSAFFISTTYSNTSSTSPRKNELNVLLIEYGFSKTSSRVLAIANILVIEFLKSSKEFATSCRSPSSFFSDERLESFPSFTGLWIFGKKVIQRSPTGVWMELNNQVDFVYRNLTIVK
jgi:hypothetical protein